MESMIFLCALWFLQFLSLQDTQKNAFLARATVGTSLYVLLHQSVSQSVSQLVNQLVRFCFSKLILGYSYPARAYTTLVVLVSVKLQSQSSSKGLGGGFVFSCHNYKKQLQEQEETLPQFTKAKGTIQVCNLSQKQRLFVW